MEDEDDPILCRRRHAIQLAEHLDQGEENGGVVVLRQVVRDSEGFELGGDDNRGQLRPMAVLLRNNLLEWQKFTQQDGNFPKRSRNRLVGRQEEVAKSYGSFLAA